MAPHLICFAYGIILDMLDAYYKNKNICFHNTPSPVPIIWHFYISSEPNPESSEYET